MKKLALLLVIQLPLILVTACSDDEENDKTVSNGVLNGHKWVDMGLPSGLKWATCNVGAMSPEDPGEYFPWGETEPKYYSQRYGVSYITLKSQGVIDNNGNLTKDYDAAAKKWGSTWRMPTAAEQQELMNYCTWTWEVLDDGNGSNFAGYKITGKNGNSIFLPATGHSYTGTIYNAGTEGAYWSASAYDNDVKAYYIFFSSYSFQSGNSYRDFGFNLRPVTK